jgi:hypothetical protein
VTGGRVCTVSTALRVELHGRAVMELYGHDFSLSGKYEHGVPYETGVRLPPLRRLDLFRLGFWLAWRAVW